MSRVSKKRNGRSWLLWLILGLGGLALLLRHLMIGKNIAVLNSQGLVAQEQHELFVRVIVMLLVVTLPVIFLLYFIAWKYRESNSKTVHNASSGHSKSFVFTIWAFPISVFVIFLVLMVPATHRLEPRKPITSSTKPLTIQVISMRWKWLFLYPDQKVASVNFVQIPKDTPIEFDLTADDAPMSSFWIPNLGGQLYSMTGHVNRLNLLANKAGDYRGSSAEINGAGFAGMLFTASVGSTEDFNSWIKKTKQNTALLDTAAYANLVKPSEDNPPAFYGSYQSDLYDTVVAKYMGSHGAHIEHEGHE